MKHSLSNYLKRSLLIFLLLIILSWYFIFQSSPQALSDIFDADNLVYFTDFLRGLLGIGEENPAFLDAEMWRQAIVLSFETLVMSILAIGFASVGMLIFLLPAAKNVVDGSLTLKTKWYYKPFFYFSRIIFLITRAVPELMWAMILVYIFQPGILPGAIALALHNFGILGKLCAEVIEDMDHRPVQSIATSGGSQMQLIIYGILPDIMPKVINYILYRFENIIRATLIVGLVGAGGLGMQFRLAMSFFRYSEITLYLICYLVLVYLTDIFSGMAKRFIR